jgi:hypothetical protein
MMHLLRRLGGLTVRRERGPVDAWLSKWGSGFAAALLLAVSVAGFSAHATTRAELLLGAAASCVACANLVLFGVLSGRVHLACHRSAVAWRIRAGELLALGVGVAVMAGGGWYVMALGLSSVAMCVGALLILATALAIMSLGLCCTLKRAE